MDDQRYDRQLSFFGAAGQHVIRKTRVTIVGCGGLGSHIAQQLSYLGIPTVALVDADRVEWSNLNRLIGAVPADAREHRLKVRVLERTILSVLPDATVQAIPTTACDKRVFDAISRSDVVFGCVDNDAARLVLTHACSVYGVPYFDTASDIVDGEYGGRVMVSLDGDSCLVCLGELDQTDLRLGFSTAQDLVIDQRIYGVDRRLLAGGGPSVVSINGVVASLAVTEFIVWRTGLRLPKRLIRYHGRECRIGESVDEPFANCYYCKDLYGNRDPHTLDQFLIPE